MTDINTPADEAATGMGWTPGPWEVSLASYGYDVVAVPSLFDGIYDGPLLWVASVTKAVGAMTRSRVYPSHDVCEANACLIAAAPDLYAALADLRKRFHAALVFSGTDPELADIACAKADAALSAARIVREAERRILAADDRLRTALDAHPDPEGGEGNDGWCFDMMKAPRDGSEIPLTDGRDVFSGFWSQVENRRSWADRNGNWFTEMDRGSEAIAKPVTVVAWRRWFAPPSDRATPRHDDSGEAR